MLYQVTLDWYALSKEDVHIQFLLLVLHLHWHQEKILTMTIELKYVDRFVNLTKQHHLLLRQHVQFHLLLLLILPQIMILPHLQM